MQKLEWDLSGTYIKEDLGGTRVGYIHRVGMSAELWALGDGDNLMAVTRYDVPPSEVAGANYVVGLGEESLGYDERGELKYWSIDMDILLKRLVTNRVDMVDYKNLVEEYDNFKLQKGAALYFVADIKERVLNLVKTDYRAGREELLASIDYPEKGCGILPVRLKDEAYFFITLEKNEAKLGIVANANLDAGVDEEVGEGVAIVRRRRTRMYMLGKNRPTVSPGEVRKILTEL